MAFQGPMHFDGKSISRLVLTLSGERVGFPCIMTEPTILNDVNRPSPRYWWVLSDPDEERSIIFPDAPDIRSVGGSAAFWRVLAGERHNRQEVWLPVRSYGPGDRVRVYYSDSEAKGLKESQELSFTIMETNQFNQMMERTSRPRARRGYFEKF